MNKLHIAVIGAGTAGSAAARRAAQMGAQVTLIDQDFPGFGSSGRSAGVYNIATLDPLDIEMRVKSRETLFELEESRGLLLARIGNVRVATTNEQMDRLQQVIDVQQSFGATDNRLVDADELQALVPDLNTDGLTGGIFGPLDGHLDGEMLCNALVADAVEAGAAVLRKTEVLDYRRTQGGAHEIVTNADVVTADAVINAAGGWGGKVARLLGYDMPVLPQVHEVVQVMLKKPLDYVVPMLNLYMPGEAAEALYFRQDGPTSLIAGMHSYVLQDGSPIANPDNYRTQVDDDYLVQVAEALTARFHVEGLGFKPGWTGLYPISPDGKFILGPEPHDNTVVTCGGMGGVGIAPGIVAGAVAVEWLIEGKPTTLPGATVLRPDRPTLTKIDRGV